ncbi:MAG: glycosyltransferase family 2 protein [Pseudomonadota bacterium]
MTINSKEKDSYVLITPARNEEKNIVKTIQAIVTQTILPLKWIIVNDNSTDQTEEIIKRAANTYSFIKLLNASEERTERSFGSKALAFRRGYEVVKNIQFDYIGNLDADVTMEPNYYNKIIMEMLKNQRLGVASGVVWDKTSNGFIRTISSLNHAVGAVQFWRKECFEAIGGYRPVSVGGIDSIAELTARMKGWETRSFADLPVYHHKPVDSAGGRTGMRIAYRAGQTEYHIGSHPLFAALKAIRRWKQSPLFLSSIIRIAAYAKLWFKKTPRDAPAELVAFLKKEQMALIKNILLIRGSNYDRYRTR